MSQPSDQTDARSQPPTPNAHHPVLLMVWDGLRPDMITEQIAPNLDRLARGGVRFTNSHAVFPTVTRCNSASIATGALPATHGMPGNTFYAPALDATQALSASDVVALRGLQALRGGRLLHRRALGEYIAQAGGRTVVVSTGSTGSAYLQHPQAADCGDLLLHPANWIGVTRAVVEATLGAMPAGSLPNTAQNAWFTRAITDYLLPEVRPALIQFWHTDPDRTQHERGIGHPETLASIKDADDNLGAILAAFARLGQEPNVIVTSDHGFSTIKGLTSTSEVLIEAGLKESAESTDVVVTGGAIYVADATRIPRIVQAMQGSAGMGPIFTGARGGPVAAGTLAMAVAGVDGDLAPDILFSAAWSDEPNEFGCRGTAWSSAETKAATHGSISPWDVRNSLVAAGPAFKRGVVSDVPAGNVDIAPTLLHLLGLCPTEQVDGRVLGEALCDGPAPEAVRVERAVLSAESGAFRQFVQRSTVGRTTYLDYGWVEA